MLEYDIDTPDEDSDEFNKNFLLGPVSDEQRSRFKKWYHQYIDDYGESFDDIIIGLFTYSILIVIWEGNAKIVKIGNILSKSKKNREFYIEVETEVGKRHIILSMHIFDMYDESSEKYETKLSIYYQEIGEDGKEYEEDIVIDESRLRTWKIIQNTIMQYKRALLDNKLN